MEAGDSLRGVRKDSAPESFVGSHNPGGRNRIHTPDSSAWRGPSAPRGIPNLGVSPCCATHGCGRGGVHANHTDKTCASPWQSYSMRTAVRTELQRHSTCTPKGEPSAGSEALHVRSTAGCPMRLRRSSTMAPVACMVRYGRGPNTHPSVSRRNGRAIPRPLAWRRGWTVDVYVAHTQRLGYSSLIHRPTQGGARPLAAESIPLGWYV